MPSKRTWIYDILLIAVLALAAYLRLTGVDWGEGQHQHPDELFLSGVAENLRAHACMDEGTPVDACPPERRRWMNPLEYFDTANSTLNPRNRGAGFYVYGNLPVTLARVAYEALGEAAGPMKYLGRQFSALADLFTILILYYLVAYLYNRKTALLAAAFSALSVMQIQQSHFFTVDLFMNPFMFAALYFAARIAYDGGAQVHRYARTPGDAENATTEQSGHATTRPRDYLSFIFHLSSLPRDPLFWNSIFFGMFLGMASASKINAVAMAVVLPIAVWLRFKSNRSSAIGHSESNETGDPQHPTRNTQHASLANAYLLVIIYLLVGGLATLLAFRIFQPYAFDTFLPNAQWLDNMKEIRAQATGLADLPWNLQWARRTHLYSFTNLTVWGLGLPLGILAWAGFLFMGWRILQGERRHILLWLWTAIYFAWQSLQFNATMRYQLPIYPLLCMMAAWLIFNVERLTFNIKRPRTFELRTLTLALGAMVLVLTAIWAFAFASIYSRPETRMTASRWIFQNVAGPINLHYENGTSQPLAFPGAASIDAAAPYTASFTAAADGVLTEIHLPHALSLTATSVTVNLWLLESPDSSEPLAASRAVVPSTINPRGQALTLKFEQPAPLKKDQPYFLRIESTGPLSLQGEGIANETDYDWNLPFRVDGYDPFGGMYRGDLNLQVYWDDNPDKLARLTNILNQTDYIFIPTNHQYAQITRLPERYPLTTVYYRELVGCPPGEDIIWCYRVAEPGRFEGRLGFDLVETFTSYPTLGPIVLNDGAAEEAFTFYDHPKVLVFKKRADYDAANVAVTLGSVDLSKVVHLTPKEAGRYEPPKTLMLPAERLAQQQAGGTWSQLFSYESLQNKYPYLGLATWYAFIFLLGLVTYPLARRALPGLADKGYALSRVFGLVLLGYVTWLLGSLGVPVSRALVASVFGGLALIGGWQAWVQKEALAAEWKSNRRMILVIEALFLGLFLLDLFIRIGNPDLWHPAKGGERPMDFSYFNAVIKSSSFPPYDPWFAGGYINYYYYGFVLVGMPVKLLGIAPSLAYNMILPTLFALVGVGAFTVGFNLVERAGLSVEHSLPADSPSTFNVQLLTGFAAAFLTLLLGNLGTIQMLVRAFQRAAAPGGVVGDAGFFQRFMWGLDGFAKMLAGSAPLPGQGEWYWNPSRVIPAPGDVEPITEFPLFTFLYSDLHAHMIVLPLALFIIAWGLSFIVAMRAARANMQVDAYTGTQITRNSYPAAPNSQLLTRNIIFSALPPIVLGALVLGALYPTNTWDAYTYMPLAAIAVAHALFNALGDWKPRPPSPTDADASAKEGVAGATSVARLGLALAGALALLTLARLFYQPYFYWFGSGYGEIDPWRGGHTPLASYFTHWGLFLFLIFAWLVWETREWMAATPLSALQKLKPYQLPIEIALAVFFILLIYLLYREAVVSLLALPMAFWAAILILRPGQRDAKRWVLFMIGTSLVLTIAVEIIVLVGDIGRMNTVFKIYLQAWTMLSVSAAAALGWTAPAIPSWRLRWRGVWQVGLTLLLAGAAFFTFTATFDKIRDRMNPEAPHTLDSMKYMETSTFWDSVNMDLGQDFRAIRWMQANAQGSPVIVEGNCPEYRWCTRFTIYTGLPGVVGWNWHQRQQRGFVEPLIIENRIAEITTFYTSPDPALAMAFLKKYKVRYIVVGQVESVYYPGEGLLKFEAYDGIYWTEVFRDGQTVVYEVK